MFSSTKTRRVSSRETPDVESTFQAVWEDMRVPSTLSSLAHHLIPQLSGLEEYGWTRRPEPERDKAERVLMNLPQENIRLIFDGRTPPTEERIFIRGDAQRQLRSVLLILGVYPFDGDFTAPDVRVYHCQPGDLSFTNQVQWDVEQLSQSFLEAFDVLPLERFATEEAPAEEVEEDEKKEKAE